MIGLEILFKIYPEKRSEFLMAFELMKSVERLEKKRTGLELFELVRDPNTFLWLEQWDDTESLTYYCNENKFRATMGAIDILGKLIHRRILSIEEETLNEQPV